MRAAIIEGGIVRNIIEAAHLGVLPGVDLIDAAGAAIGDTWDGAHFTRPPPPPETAEQLRARFKASRAVLVDAIVVSVDGMPFDGDETSQNRMGRAIVAMQAVGEPSTLWVLHDNTPAEVTLGQLQRALVAAGQAQTNVWVAP